MLGLANAWRVLHMYVMCTGSIPSKTQLLMEAADLDDLKDDEEEWLDLFPAPPPARLQESRSSHVAYRCVRVCHPR
jgi:hypothetical protein